MFHAIKQVYQLFNKQSQRKLNFLLLATAITGIFEVMTLSAMMPFVMLISKPELIDTSQTLQKFSQVLSLHSHQEVIIMVGLIVIGALFIGNLFSAWIAAKQLSFAHQHGHILSCALFRQYLAQPYTFFINHNTNTLSKNVLSEVGRVILGVVLPSLQMLAKVVAVTAILSVLLFHEPIITLLMLLTLGGIYAGVYFALKSRLNLLGHLHSMHNQQRYKIVDEIFSGIKAIKLNQHAEFLQQQYHQPSQGLAECDIKSQLIPQVTRYALESVVYGGIIFLAIFLIQREGSVTNSLPILTLFAFAGFRIMPALQQLFNCATSIQYHFSCIRIVHDCLHKTPIQALIKNKITLPTLKTVELNNIFYQYPSSKQAVLRKIDFAITQGECVGIVGTTGAGKTTLIDILLGLLEPQSGATLVNGQHIEMQTSDWNTKVGYVPQDIFLADCTIWENITFGQPQALVDMQRVAQVCQVAQIHDTIAKLPKGYNTPIGERGVKLSGGQRQRIGIARALYNQPELLVLDEATSALDSQTEHKLLASLAEFSQTMMMVMVAHRLASIKQCDKIYYLKDGLVKGKGTFSQLQLQLDDFAKLTQQQMQAH